MRIYVTPERLNKMNPNIPDICVKCNVEKGTLFHCLWDCPKIQKFWNEVIKCISKMTLNPVPDNPALCILKFVSKGLYVKQQREENYRLCLVQARRLISLCWKDVKSPSVGRWLKELSACLILEKLTYTMKKKSVEFKEI